MNFTALAVHGLSGLSVHADTIVIRILSATAGLLALSAVVGFGLLVLHTHAAGWGPRWLLVCLLAAAVSLLQMFSTAFASALLLLHRRSQPQSLPSAHFRGQIAERIWLGAGAPDHG